MKNSFIEKNPEKWKAYRKAWYIKNKERIKEYQIKNKDKLKEYYQKWLLENKENEKNRKAQWYLENKERVKKTVRKYLVENREKVIARRQKWRAKHPDRVKAQYTLHRQVIRGIIKPLPCFRCGCLDTEAHHGDYSKPLEVIWLCRKHHAEADTERRVKDSR